MWTEFYVRVRRFYSLNSLRADPLCLAAFEKLVAQYNVTASVMVKKKSEISSVITLITDIAIAEIKQETQDLVHDNENGTSSVNKTAGHL